MQALRTSTACLLSVTVGFLFTLVATGAVVCLCHDGHISIESRCNPVQCCPEDIAGPGDDAALDAIPGSAHNCFDLALNDEVIGARVARSEEAVIVSPPDTGALVPHVDTMVWNPPISPRSSKPTTEVAPQPAIQRMVVLTI